MKAQVEVADSSEPQHQAQVQPGKTARPLQRGVLIVGPKSFPRMIRLRRKRRKEVL
jgi:hypothetical protein